MAMPTKSPKTNPERDFLRVAFLATSPHSSMILTQGGGALAGLSRSQRLLHAVEEGIEIEGLLQHDDVAIAGWVARDQPLDDLGLHDGGGINDDGNIRCAGLRA